MAVMRRWNKGGKKYCLPISLLHLGKEIGSLLFYPPLEGPLRQWTRSRNSSMDASALDVISLRKTRSSVQHLHFGDCNCGFLFIMRCFRDMTCLSMVFCTRLCIE